VKRLRHWRRRGSWKDPRPGREARARGGSAKGGGTAVAAPEPGGLPEIEVSGGIRLDNVREFALPGVKYISVGALTHSAPALDLSLLVVDVF